MSITTHESSELQLVLSTNDYLVAGDILPLGSRLCDFYFILLQFNIKGDIWGVTVIEPRED